MELKIGQMYLLLPSTKEVWDVIKRTYSYIRNLAQVFEIRCKLKEIKQGNHCVTQYYTDLQALWQELDLFIEANCCLECTEKQRRSIEKESMFDFLAGHNEELDEVDEGFLERSRCRLLMKCLLKSEGKKVEER